MVLLSYNLQLLGVEQSKNVGFRLNAKVLPKCFLKIIGCQVSIQASEYAELAGGLLASAIGNENDEYKIFLSWKAEESVIAKTPGSFIFEYSTKSIYC